MKTDVRMTGPGLLELAEDLERRSRQMSREWLESPDVSRMFLTDPDLAKKMSVKWNALADVFGEARRKVYSIVKDEIHEESCGA
jgi:hypothetical protein